MFENILHEFQKFLTSCGIADEKHATFYARWVNKFLSFSNTNENLTFSETKLKFHGQLSNSAEIAD